MILCIGSAADPTFLHGLAVLRRHGVETAAVDIAQLILEGSFVLDADDPGASSITVAGRSHVFSEAAGVLVRLPDLVHDDLTDAVRTRTWSTLRALSSALRRLALLGVPVVNAPTADVSGFSKPVHLLRLATRAGLRVPETLVSNDPDAVRAFVTAHHGRVILKGVSSHKTWVRAWDDERDTPRLGLIRSTPIQLQRRITGSDIRVHTVGDSLFAERIDSAVVDYRRVRGSSSFRAVACPEDIASACRALVRTMAAPLLGIDFKVDPDSGEWLFLEANTMPCYQGYDRRADGAISTALVALLTGRNAFDEVRAGSPAPQVVASEA